MTPVFADAYYWFALVNPRDQSHQQAQTLSQSLSEPLVTTTWVLTEVGDAMHDPVNRPTFIRLMEAIANDSQTTVILRSRSGLIAAWPYSRPDSTRSGP